jgi:predicted AAA+ superfamily ATPase
MTVMYDRFIQKSIESNLFKGKVIVIYGARQVGKTTISKSILSLYPNESLYLNCELDSTRRELSFVEPKKLKSFFGDKKIIVLDEAQTIDNIGTILKTFVDEYKDIQIIATGSSSFGLASLSKESLTGRSFEFIVYPLSTSEIIDKDGLVDYKQNIENIFRFGMYPKIYSNRLNQEEMIRELETLTSSYLYKDLLNFQGIRKPKIIEDLLRLLAFQIGSEVSLRELALKVGVNIETVDHYIDILEKSFIVFRLRPLSRNLRKEVRSTFKVYFFDLGIRNTIISNLNNLNIRDDIGKIFENFFIIERLKKMSKDGVRKNIYFWRTYDQKKIDLIEESDGFLTAFECKFKEGKISRSTKELFSELYKNSNINIITFDNYLDFLI